MISTVKIIKIITIVKIAFSNDCLSILDLKIRTVSDECACLLKI